jgi:hypothetical protein
MVEDRHVAGGIEGERPRDGPDDQTGVTDAAEGDEDGAVGE